VSSVRNTLPWFGELAMFTVRFRVLLYLGVSTSNGQTVEN
jgi:hypothetical protein